VITAATNLMQLQKVIKNVVDFAAVKSHLEAHNLPHFTFYPKYIKPIKAVIRYLHVNSPAEDTSEGLMDLGFDIISVKQMSSTRRSPSEGTPTKVLTLFLITLPRTAKPKRSSD
jgi:hypothetical protein